MRQILSRSLLTAAAASSIIAVTGGYAYADSGAQGEAQGSPGILSGNSVEIPLNAPVNACGNTVDGVGALNPAMGNSCGNGVAPATPQVTTPPPSSPPAPHHAPPAHEAPPAPSTPLKQQVTPPPVSHPTQDPAVSSGLAETGVSGGELGAAAGTSAVLLVGGALLYRRAARQSRIRRAID
ncbi:chaplin [Streptomyces sp. CA-111067]|uniref:chaplin n=1 Tax=Streptomyces sp. CA-111067 TaxID=3240046 RepID=UPI003D951C34